ncbi:MAG TPA: hypothetical protein VEQ85_07145, partial [Lacipirellulaceae bacterium]|nr:hypothetical protein [Lacipirellulaceae bacterium]
PPNFGIERNRITAESWSVPGPQVTLPHEMRELLATGDPLLLRLPRSTAELFEIRVRAALNRVDSALYPLFPTPITDLAARDRVRRVMRQLLAPELAAGMKLNVNRPFGNGRDDSGANETGYGVVDEAGEDAVGDDYGTARRLWASTGAAGEERLDPRFERSDANFVPLDVTWEGDASPAGVRTDRDSLFQRQLLARHIYVLGLTLTVEPDFDGADQARRGDANMARRLAQWAINAVDFRDADGIMTAYEYDANPFDGWAPDGDPRTTADHAGPDGNPGNADDTLVWGAERPELVITETLSWHDRNTTDEADEDPNEGEQPGDSSDPLNEIGGEFDQKFRPRGAFFLELYNPWPASASASLDLHAIDGSGRDLGVNLAAVAGPDRNTPVWRLAIYRDVDPRKDPDDPNPANRPRDIDRTAYFTSFDPQFGDPDRQIPPVANWPDDGTAFFNDYDDAFTRVVKPVRPGRYMVIGSGTEIEPGSGTYFAQLGQRQDQLASDRPRKPLRGMEFNLGPASATKSLVRMVDNMAAPGATANRGRVPGDNTRPFIMEAPRESLALEQGAPASAPLVAGSVDSFTDVAMINAASDRTGNKIGRRLTLTEPTNGYPTRFGNVEWVSRTRLEEAGVLPDPSEDGMYCWGGNPRQPKPIDTPLDDGDDDLRNIGTRYNYRRIFIHRLADTLAPY